MGWGDFGSMAGGLIGGPGGSAIGGMLGGAIEANYRDNYSSNAPSGGYTEEGGSRVSMNSGLQSGDSLAGSFSGMLDAASPYFNKLIQYQSAQDVNRQNQQNFNTGMGFNAEEAQKQRDFQERMSNTSWQRAVGDMTKAGLSPMLAYSQGGAPQGAGSSASAPAPIPKVNALAGAVSTAAQIAQIRNIEADTDNKFETNALIRAQTAQQSSSAGNLDAQTSVARSTLSKINAEISHLIESAGAEKDKAALYRAQEAVSRLEKLAVAGKIDIQDLQKVILQAEGVIVGNSIQRSENESRAQHSWWMRNVSPYLPDMLKSGTILNRFGEKP